MESCFHIIIRHHIWKLQNNRKHERIKECGDLTYCKEFIAAQKWEPLHSKHQQWNHDREAMGLSGTGKRDRREKEGAESCRQPLVME